MKTRHLLLVALSLVMCAASARAGSGAGPQDSVEYLNLLRLDLRAAKAEIVAGALELTPEELERFGPIYREYDRALMKLNEERTSTLRDFAANYASIDDDEARDLTRRSFEFQRRRLDLLEKLYERVSKAFNPGTGARVIQLEHQLLMLVDVQLSSELPLIPRQAIVQRFEPR